ncbi:hypothetical protein E1301_Tti021596 [Triplophysa tibetana]|uniref:Uncharacterized protein n=1 Tax=Triplophysa tibetana TaxID=1572043 RepID=A0A5A9NU63_9TELE|nr:hypothetical protein E1301_Tti021596 [Triplophysa tibetana]
MGLKTSRVVSTHWSTILAFLIQMILLTLQSSDRLNKCKITDVSALTDTLAQTRALRFLKVLDLSNNKIKELKKLHEVLKSSNCELSLYWCNITDVTALTDTLAQAQTLRFLKVLDLGYNKIKEQKRLHEVLNQRIKLKVAGAQIEIVWFHLSELTISQSQVTVMRLVVFRVYFNIQTDGSGNDAERIVVAATKNPTQTPSLDLRLDAGFYGEQIIVTVGVRRHCGLKPSHRSLLKWIQCETSAADLHTFEDDISRIFQFNQRIKLKLVQALMMVRMFNYIQRLDKLKESS